MITPETIQALLDFRKERQWEKYHNPKDLAMAISIETNELLELYLWRYDLAYIDKGKIADEVADILIFLIYFLNFYDFNADELIKQKLEKNSQKYPVSDSKDKWK